MQYNEKYIFLVYVIVNLCLIGLIYLMYFVNIGDYLHSYKGSGTIAAYYGVNAPDGWVVCDGQNGTPDLRGKFVYGGNIFSQYLYNNAYNTNAERYFIDYTEQLQGGSNYQTLTNKIEILDKYTFNRPSENTSINVLDVINDNPNINRSNEVTQTTLDVINDKPITHPTSKLDRIINAGTDLILTPEQENTLQNLSPTDNYDNKLQEIVTTQQIKNAEQIQLTNRINNVRKELEEIGDYAPEETDTKIIEQQVIDAESTVEVILPPDYDGYKYPSHKNLNADLNLPPYYAMIYIMKL